MPRTADKPGTFRIRPKPDGTYRLSGINKDGHRVKLVFGSESEARSVSQSVFGRGANESLPRSGGVQSHSVNDSPSGYTGPLDDWGLPLLTEETAQAVNTSIGVDAPLPKPAEDVVKAEQRKKNAQSLAELLGVGYAAGTVIVAKKLTDLSGKDPCDVNPKQVKQLAESSKETIQGWFGDMEIKPWIMTILLTFGIIVSMLLQSKKKEKPKELSPSPSTEQSPPVNLRAVPSSDNLPKY